MFNPDDFTGIIEPDYTYNSLERRELIGETIPRFLDIGYNKTNLLEGYRSIGLGITQRDFSKIYDAFASGVKPGERIQFLNSDQTLFNSILGQGKPDMDANYFFVAEVRYFDLTSDETLTGHFFVYTDDLTDKADLEDLLLQSAREHESYTGKSLLSADIIKGYRKIDI